MFGPAPTLIEWDTDIPPLDVLLLEGGEVTLRILADRLDQGELRAARAAAQLDAVLVLAPLGHVGHQVDAEGAAARDDARDRRQRGGEVLRPNQRLHNTVGGDDHRKRARTERERPNIATDQLQRSVDLRI